MAAELYSSMFLFLGRQSISFSRTYLISMCGNVPINLSTHIHTPVICVLDIGTHNNVDLLVSKPNGWFSKFCDYMH